VDDVEIRKHLQQQQQQWCGNSGSSSIESAVLGFALLVLLLLRMHII
jgi:hypothetical protein